MIAFWLLPSAEYARVLAKIVSELAVEFDAPIFEPHVTLYAGAIESGAAITALHKVDAPKSIRLDVQGIAHSDVFTKTLFVQFHRSSEAQVLSERLRTFAAGAAIYEFKPHLSLLYRTLPCATKANLAARVQLLFSKVEFDRLKVITGPDETLSGSDVEAWQTVATRAL